MILTVCTDQPAIQIYTSNVLTKRAGKDGAIYDIWRAIALEPQSLPNAVNCPAYPPVILQRGEEYRREIIFAFEHK